MTPLVPPFIQPGFNTLLIGPPGTGKTHSIGTIVDLGIDTYYLALEAGMESLTGYWRDRGKEIPPNLRWHKVASPVASFEQMIATAKNVNTLNLESLAKLSDPNRSKYNQFIGLLTALNDFIDERTGESFGSVASWDQTKLLVIDGMTGINVAAMQNVIGGKPIRSQTDWQIAQNLIEALVRMLCDNCPCHFVLLGHVEREVDPVLGGVKIMTSTLGKALAPKIPSMFSDVVLTERASDKWSWNTASSQADTKIRNLPIASGINPDFRLIVEKWAARNKAQ